MSSTSLFAMCNGRFLGIQFDIVSRFVDPSGWDVTDCVFSFTGLGSAQCKALTDQAHVYLTENGRISMAGLNSHNIRYVRCIWRLCVY